MTSSNVDHPVELLAALPLNVDGPPTPVSIPSHTEAKLEFAGSVGDDLGIAITDLATAAASPTTVSVYYPSGSVLANFQCFVDGTLSAANLNLTSSGVYRVTVHPGNFVATSLQVWLSRNIRGTLTPGQPLQLALARPGQNARLEFDGVLGELLVLQIRNVMSAPPGQKIYARITGPGGTFFDLSVPGLGKTFVRQLDATGTYVLRLEPNPSGKGAATVTMDVLIDRGQPLVVDVLPLTGECPIPGSAAWFTFAGVTGQSLGLAVRDMALAPSNEATVSIYEPNGANLTSFSSTGVAGGNSANALAALPDTGVYGVLVQPGSGATGSFSIFLSSTVTGTLTAKGPPLPVHLDRPGRLIRLTFVGTKGRKLRLRWSDLVGAGAAAKVFASFKTPAGSLKSSFLTENAGTFDIGDPPATGDYFLTIISYAGRTFTTNLALEEY